MRLKTLTFRFSLLEKKHPRLFRIASERKCLWEKFKRTQHRNIVIKLYDITKHILWVRFNTWFRCFPSSNAPYREQRKWCLWKIFQMGEARTENVPDVTNNSQVKSSHLYLYSAFNNTNCDKATAQYQNGKIVSIM